MAPLETVEDKNHLDRLIAERIQDPATSYWLREALQKAMARDPVDAARDASDLAELLLLRSVFVLDQSISA